jgi:hypothetical protein
MHFKTLHSAWLGSFGVLVLAFCGGHPPNAAAKQSTRITPRVAQAPAAGNAFYASPTGTPSGDGSLDAPWDLRPRGTPAIPSATGGGGGTYVGTFIDAQRHRRTADRRAAVPANRHETAPPRESRDLGPRSTVVRGFEVMSSDAHRQTLQTGSSPPEMLAGRFPIYQTRARIPAIHNLVV